MAPDDVAPVAVNEPVASYVIDDFREVRPDLDARLVRLSQTHRRSDKLERELTQFLSDHFGMPVKRYDGYTWNSGTHTMTAHFTEY